MRYSALYAALMVSMTLLGTACASPTGTPPGGGTPQAIYTAAAQTMSAQLTLEAGSTAVAQLTQIASQPTGTPVFVEPTPTPSLPTETPTPTAVPPTPVPCDRAEFVSDVTSLDNATVFPGSAFTRIWRVRNVGSCDWTPAYALVFAGGSPMVGPNAVFLPANVRPGETVDLSVTLTAPSSPGYYRSDWLLRNPGGILFGMGSDASQPLVLEIVVAGQVVPTSRGAYDFAVRACDAVWRSATAALGCPGSIEDSNGSVILLTNPILESGLENEPALWTRPNLAANGSISGLYPGYVVRSGDRFRAEVGCLGNSYGCDVIFRLDYRAGGGTSYNLGQWREVYDGLATSIDLDLSPLAGDSVQFLLSLENRGDPEDANGAWFSPMIQGTTSSQSNQVLAWNQRGGPDNICEDLRVFLNGRTQGTAQARNCRSGTDLGSILLTAEELNQVLAWSGQLAPFDAELFNADLGEPLTAYITFSGRGSGEATNAYITAMSDFAERLYNRIAP